MRSAAQEQCLEHEFGLGMAMLSIVNYHYPLEEPKVLSHVAQGEIAQKPVLSKYRTKVIMKSVKYIKYFHDLADCIINKNNI